MSKFCNQCGSQLEDGAAFCRSCGARQAQAAAQQPPPPVSQMPPQPVYGQPVYAPQPGVKKGNKAILIGVAAVAVVLVVVLCLVLFSGPGYKGAVDTLIAVNFRGEAGKLEKLAPKEYWDYIEEQYDQSLDDIKDSFDDNFENYMDSMEDDLGTNIRVTYKITEAEKMDASDLKSLKSAITNYLDISKSAISEAYKLSIEFTARGSEDSDENDADLVAVRINNNWYLCSESGYFILNGIGN